MLPLQKKTFFGHSTRNCNPFLLRNLSSPKRDVYVSSDSIKIAHKLMLNNFSRYMGSWSLLFNMIFLGYISKKIEEHNGSEIPVTEEHNDSENASAKPHQSNEPGRFDDPFSNDGLDKCYDNSKVVNDGKPGI